jgi:hypothetical protein
MLNDLRVTTAIFHVIKLNSCSALTRWLGALHDNDYIGMNHQQPSPTAKLD